MRKLFLLLSLFILSLNSWAKFCSDPNLETLPSFSEGRMQPLIVHASKSLKQIFGKNPCPSFNQIETYCLLSTGRSEEIKNNSNCKLTTLVKHHELLTMLGRVESEIDIFEALNFKQALIEKYNFLEESKNEDSSLAQAIGTLLNKLALFEQIRAGDDWKFLNQNHTWKSINTSNPNEILASKSNTTADESKRLDLEYNYQKYSIFALAIFLSILGFIFSLLSARTENKFFSKLTIFFFSTSLMAELCAMIMRTLISGRSPITNMYETVMLTGAGGLLLAGILHFALKNKHLLPIGFTINLVCLFMMRFSTEMLDGEIKPLVPVLRDNFWLSTHVTTITLSYACFALAWFVTNYVLARFIFKSTDFNQTLETWNKALRIILQVGVVFLAAGILLGGIWADYSWGRFWGWDPKETWSLISLIIYVIILHGKYANWFKDVLFTIVTNAAFMFILMTWFGVNYVLSAGLHSYGSSTGGTSFLISIFIFETAILTLSLLRWKNLKT